MIQPEKAALLMIDMQNAFIDEDSALCVAGAAATIAACAHALDHARKLGMAVFHVHRAYDADGSNVEPVRYKAWAEGGRPLSPAATSKGSMNWPDLLTPADGDRVMVKPRFSAFFDTPLDSVLVREGITTVVLAGTTTHNCVRSTCYDALSLNYNVVVLEDATSSRTPEVQRANIEDMAFIGAHIMSVEEFCGQGLSQVHDAVAEMAADIAPQIERNDEVKRTARSLPPMRPPRGI